MKDWTQLAGKWESPKGTILTLRWDDEGFTYWEAVTPGDPNRYRYTTLEEAWQRTELREAE